MATTTTVKSIGERFPFVGLLARGEVDFDFDNPDSLPSIFDFERLKVPAGGAVNWQLPDGSAVKEFVAAIIATRTIRSYWAEEFAGAGNAPDCSSFDGITGYGTPGGDCATCPLSQFGDDKSPPECREQIAIVLSREGATEPEMLLVPPGSFKNVKPYLKRTPIRAPSATRFSLSSGKNDSGIAYSSIVVQADAPYTLEDKAVFQSARRFLQAALNRTALPEGYSNNAPSLAERTGHVDGSAKPTYAAPSKPWTPIECVEHDAAYTPEGVLVCRRCKKVLEEPEPAQAGLV